MLRRQSGTGPGRNDRTGRSAGRGTRCCAGHGRRGDGRYRTVPVRHGYVRIDVHAAAVAFGAQGGRGSQSGIGADGIGAAEGTCGPVAGWARQHPRIGQTVECGDLRATGGREAHRAPPGECAREDGGIQSDRHVAAPQRRPGQGDGPGAICRRYAAARNATRGYFAAAGARCDAEIGGHCGGGKGERRAGGERRRDDRGAR